jgi:hypothetical protein
VSSSFWAARSDSADLPATDDGATRTLFSGGAVSLEASAKLLCPQLLSADSFPCRLHLQARFELGLASRVEFGEHAVACGDIEDGTGRRGRRLEFALGVVGCGSGILHRFFGERDAALEAFGLSLG